MTMRTVVSLAAASLVGVLLASPGMAADAAGYLKTVSGKAVIVTAGAERPAEAGGPVYPADVIRTGADGAVGVTFKDDTRISVGPETEFSIDSYVFDPRQNKLGFTSRVQRGTLQYLSGAIAKLEPDAVAVETPSGTIGVRGTRFVVKVDQ